MLDELRSNKRHSYDDQLAERGCCSMCEMASQVDSSLGRLLSSPPPAWLLRTTLRTTMRPRAAAQLGVGRSGLWPGLAVRQFPLGSTS